MFVDVYRVWVSLYGAIGLFDVGEIEVASHPEYIVAVYGWEVFDWVTRVVYVVYVTIWITTETKRITRRKQRAYNRCRNKPTTSREHRKYRELQKQTKQLCKSAYITYINNLSTNPKRLYSYIKHQINDQSGIQQLQDFNFFQSHYVGTHFVVAVCAFGGHRIEKKPLDFKLMLQLCEIDLFTYPTLAKSPAEIALPGCEWQQVKTLSYMTWEYIGTIKLIKHIIKSNIYTKYSLFYQKYDKNVIFFNLKKLPTKKYYQF